MVVNQIIGRRVSMKTELAEFLTKTLRQLDKWRTKAEVLQAEVERLNKENDQLSKHNQDLCSANVSLRAENADLQRRVDELERNASDVKQDSQASQPPKTINLPGGMPYRFEPAHSSTARKQ